MSTHSTQANRILALLMQDRGAWVSLPKIMECAAQYNARIFELRRAGYRIENRTEEIAGTRHSWFRLLPDRALALQQNQQVAQSGPIGPHETPLASIGARDRDSNFLDYETGRRRAR